MTDEFGLLLKKHREQAGLSQNQLVEGLRRARYEDRYGESDVSKWEHGRIPPEDVVEELEEILCAPKGLLLRAAGYRSAAEYRRMLGDESKPPPVGRHYEDVRTAIRNWLVLIQGPRPSLFNPAALGEPTHFGFGLTWCMGPAGIAAKLSVENAEFFPLLSSHLAPPIVEADFWGQVEGLKDTGTNYLVRGSQLGEQITEVSQAETGLTTVTSWRCEPNMGITTEFGATISRSALGVEQCTSYAYFELAIVYLDSGIMVTQVDEGVRLLQGAGLDPTLTTAYVSTAGAWVIPQGNQRLICDGAVEANKPVVRAIHFVLQLHGYVIAIGSLEQIRHCRDVHRQLVQKYAGSPDTTAVLELREKLESTSKAISAELERASLQHQFPGRCPFCPA